MRPLDHGLAGVAVGRRVLGPVTVPAHARKARVDLLPDEGLRGLLLLGEVGVLNPSDEAIGHRRSQVGHHPLEVSGVRLLRGVRRVRSYAPTGRAAHVHLLVDVEHEGRAGDAVEPGIVNVLAQVAQASLDGPKERHRPICGTQSLKFLTVEGEPGRFFAECQRQALDCRGVLLPGLVDEVGCTAPCARVSKGLGGQCVAAEQLLHFDAALPFLPEQARGLAQMLRSLGLGFRGLTPGFRCRFEELRRGAPLGQHDHAVPHGEAPVLKCLLVVPREVRVLQHGAGPTRVCGLAEAMRLRLRECRDLVGPVQCVAVHALEVRPFRFALDQHHALSPREPITLAEHAVRLPLVLRVIAVHGGPADQSLSAVVVPADDRDLRRPDHAERQYRQPVPNALHDPGAEHSFGRLVVE